jgi:nicotine blue oxidoreductase
MLEHVVATMRAACDRVVVVLGAHADDVRARADLGGAEVVVCADWSAGTFASLSCGLAVLGDAHDAVVVVLGDQPTLTAERIGAVLGASGPVVRARDGGAPSHPVVIRRGALVTPEILRSADGPELGPLADVDTPESLQNLGR